MHPIKDKIKLFLTKMQRTLELFWFFAFVFYFLDSTWSPFFFHPPLSYTIPYHWCYSWLALGLETGMLLPDEANGHASNQTKRRGRLHCITEEKRSTNKILSHSRVININLMKKINCSQVLNGDAAMVIKENIKNVIKGTFCKSLLLLLMMLS